MASILDRFSIDFLIDFEIDFWRFLGRQDGHKTPQDGHKTPQDAAKAAQVGPKMRPTRHQDGEGGHVEARWLQEGFGTRKY